MTEVGQAIVSLWDTARRWADAEIAKDPDGARVKRIASELCLDDGKEPEQVVMGYAGQEPYRGARGTVAVVLPIQPAWVLYVRDARRAIELVENARDKTA